MIARILVVDDQDLIRDGIVQILRNEPDFEVVGGSGDTEGAVRLARELRPDVVIMDLDIPGEGGLMAIRRIRAADPNVKIVVMTGHLETHLVEAAQQAGVHAYLLKVVGAAELVAEIRAVRAGALSVPALPSGAGPAPTKASRLSRDDTELLSRLADGKTVDEIASGLQLDAEEVEGRRQLLMSRLGLASEAALTKYALREGLTDL